MSDDKKSQEGSQSNSKTDQELSDLLDSALDDFSKEKQAEPLEKKKEDDVGASADNAEWSDEFIKQAAAQFESSMSTLFSGDGGNQFTPDQLQQSFQKMAEAASQVLASPNEISEESQVFASTISQTLQGLSEGSEAVQAPFSEDDIMSMFSGGAGSDQNAFLPFMQGMMQSLLSKEVLYPSLKDILEKYPQWLEENKNNISADDLDRYKKQQQLMEKVCVQLEKESEADTPEKKREQFESVLSLMQKLQDYGQPPVELVGDVGPGLPVLDGQQNMDPNQCSIA